MSRASARLVLLLLLITLPLRAVGAVTMLGCVAHGNEPGPSAAAHGVHPTGSAHALHHAAHVAHDAQEEAHVGHVPREAALAGVHGMGSCHGCGDCCMGVNALPTTFASSYGEAAPVLPRFLPWSYVGFQPESAERPPRQTVRA